MFSSPQSVQSEHLNDENLSVFIGNTRDKVITLSVGDFPEKYEAIKNALVEIRKFCMNNNVKTNNRGGGWGSLLVNDERKHDYDPGGISINCMLRACGLDNLVQSVNHPQEYKSTP